MVVRAVTEDVQPVVRLVSLTKVFGETRGISNISLEVTAGQVFGFLGPNGAGKSTTIRLMMGLHLPTAGRAYLFDLDARQHGPQVRRRVGYLPGELALHQRLTGRETLDRIARMRGDHDDAIRVRLEQRFAAELDRPVRALSKGNRQKIGLIQAFMHDPELLVLDEPTSGLDPLLQKEFADLLEEYVDRGRTAFLSSHDLDEVQRLANRIAIIRKGELVASDTVEALRMRAPRTVELTFRSAVDPAAFANIPGVTVTSNDTYRVGFRVVGHMGALFEAAVRFGIADVSAQAASLDELFLDFYAEPSRRVGSNVG
jgi:ABC-2 type transport system ATP-binding protein